MPTAPFYGDPTAKAKVWNKWAVLLGGLAATVPVAPASFVLNDSTGPVINQWDPVGALDEDSPFGDGEESIDVTSHTAAGFGTYAKTYKNQEETIEFTALETTLTTLGILYDASGLTDEAGTITGTLKQRDPGEKFLIGFQRENATEMERRISENFAQINTITRNTGDGRSTYTVSVTIYPTTTKAIYDYYLGPLV